jgi:hypothetical protein
VGRVLGSFIALAVALVGACGLDRTGDVGGTIAETDPSKAAGDSGSSPGSSDGSSGSTSSEGGADIDAAGGFGPCPPICNGGCDAATGACTINITSETTATINCPPNRPCIVRCTGVEVCKMAINCAAGQPCTQLCSGKEACKGESVLNKNGASSSCLVCVGGGGSKGCDGNKCIGGTPCSKVCDSFGCGDGCNSCTTVTACP